LQDLLLLILDYADHESKTFVDHEFLVSLQVS